MEKKYELTDETMEFYDAVPHILHRIRALKDFTLNGYAGDVKAGDLGGWIESEDNLSQDGKCWVGENAKVYGGAKVYEDALVSNIAVVSENAKVYGKAKVCRWSQLHGNADVSGNAFVHGNAHVYENAEVYGHADVYDNAQIYGNASVSENVYVYGDAQVFGDAKVSGDIWIHEDAYVQGNTNLDDSFGKLDIRGNANIKSDKDIDKPEERRTFR